MSTAEFNKELSEEEFDKHESSETDLALEKENDDFASQENLITEDRSEVDLLQEALQKEKDKFLRLFAEFENYKKRTIKERQELYKTAGQDVLQAVLPVLDDFDRALVEIGKTKEKELLKGIELIHQKLKDTLTQKGLKEIDITIGDPFDAEVHEAITQIPAPDKKLIGKIVDVVEKGYQLADKIIRYPKVVVGK